MKRIVLSIVRSCAFCASLGCGPDSGAVADDQPDEAVPSDAGVASGIGTSPGPTGAAAPPSLGGGK